MSRTYKTSPYWVRLKNVSISRNASHVMEKAKGLWEEKEIEIPVFKPLKASSLFASYELKHSLIYNAQLIHRGIVEVPLDEISDDMRTEFVYDQLSKAYNLLEINGERVWDSSKSLLPFDKQTIAEMLFKYLDKPKAYNTGYFNLVKSSTLHFATPEGFIVSLCVGEVFKDSSENFNLNSFYSAYKSLHTENAITAVVRGMMIDIAYNPEFDTSRGGKNSIVTSKWDSDAEKNGFRYDSTLLGGCACEMCREYDTDHMRRTLELPRGGRNQLRYKVKEMAEEYNAYGYIEDEDILV